MQDRAASAADEDDVHQSDAEIEAMPRKTILNLMTTVKTWMHE